MKVNITFDVGNIERVGIAREHGADSHIADYQETRDFIFAVVYAALEDMGHAGRTVDDEKKDKVNSNCSHRIEFKDYNKARERIRDRYGR